MIRTQIQLTDRQWKQLKERASERGVSMAAEIRSAVEKRLSDGGDPVKTAAEILEEIAGFRSGLTDVSERHDDHLADAYAD